MSTQRLAIAMVEQDPATQELYQRALLQDFDVFPCTNTIDARLIIQEHKISVVVVEPVGSGWHLIHELKGRIPVIVCSIREVEQPDIRRILAAVLVKPVLPSELLEVVQRVIKNVLQE